MAETGYQPIAVLLAEHELTRRMLAVLHGLASKLATDGAFDRDDVDIVLGFFRDFVGGLHHEKETSVVYPLVAMSGDDAGAGAVGQLTADHDESETLLRALTLHRDSCGPDDADRRAFARIAQTYCDRLERHMDEEERELFPIAAALPGDDRLRMREEFARIERTGLSIATWTERVDRLTARYVRGA